MIVPIDVEGGLSSVYVDIAANVVDNRLHLVAPNNGGSLDRVDLGSLFFGQKRSTTATLVNPGPTPLAFAILYHEHLNVSSDGSDMGEQAYEKQILVSPAHGIVKAFSDQPLCISFEPVLFILQKGFHQKFLADIQENVPVQRRIMLEAIETGQNLSFTASAM